MCMYIYLINLCVCIYVCIYKYVFVLFVCVNVCAHDYQVHMWRSEVSSGAGAFPSTVYNIQSTWHKELEVTDVISICKYLQHGAGSEYSGGSNRQKALKGG